MVHFLITRKLKRCDSHGILLRCGGITQIDMLKSIVVAAYNFFMCHTLKYYPTKFGTYVYIEIIYLILLLKYLTLEIFMGIPPTKKKKKKKKSLPKL